VKKEESPSQEYNLLKLVPVRNISWEKSDEGLISLLKPKIQITFLAKLLLHRMKHPYYRVKLDEIGSHFWEHCDGHNTIEKIAVLQQQAFGDKVEPIYERIGQFLQTLERHKFITFEKSEEKST
jgi:hypothetical protein